MCHRTLDPVWDAEFVFKGTKDELLRSGVSFRIYDYDGRGASADKLGSAVLALTGMEASGEPQEFIMDVTDPKVKGSRGHIVVEVRYFTVASQKQRSDEESGVRCVPTPASRQCTSMLIPVLPGMDSALRCDCEVLIPVPPPRAPRPTPHTPPTSPSPQVLPGARSGHCDQRPLRLALRDGDGLPLGDALARRREGARASLQPSRRGACRVPIRHVAISRSSHVTSSRPTSLCLTLFLSHPCLTHPPTSLTPASLAFPQVLRLEVGEGDDAAQGANIAPFSLYPRDNEVAYLPGTFLQYISRGILSEEPMDEDEPAPDPRLHHQNTEEVHMVKVSPQFA